MKKQATQNEKKELNRPLIIIVIIIITCSIFTQLKQQNECLVDAGLDAHVHVHGGTYGSHYSEERNDARGQPRSDGEPVIRKPR